MPYARIASSSGNNGGSATTNYSITWTPGANNGATVSIGYNHTAAVAIASIKNQAGTAIPYTEPDSGYWIGTYGYGQHGVWIP